MRLLQAAFVALYEPRPSISARLRSGGAGGRLASALKSSDTVLDESLPAEEVGVVWHFAHFFVFCIARRDSG